MLGDERGNVLALTAVGLPLILGCAALAVDTAQWVFAKRELQSTADAAANRSSAARASSSTRA